MDDVALGRRFRAIRHRLRWRQVDVAARAAVSQDRISMIERGHLDHMPVVEIRRVAKALDAELVQLLRWRGGDLDRLMDEGHARLVGVAAGLLREASWLVQPEVSYAVYGQRGSMDLLAWHPRRAVLLVIEVKTELVSIEETLRKHDEKVRLAGAIAEERFGWRAGSVAKILVLPSLSTPRRQVARHGSVLDAGYPTRGFELRRWLQEPARPTAGILFLEGGERSAERGYGIARKRIRLRRAESNAVDPQLIGRPPVRGGS